MLMINSFLGDTLKVQENIFLNNYVFIHKGIDIYSLGIIHILHFQLGGGVSQMLTSDYMGGMG